MHPPRRSRGGAPLFGKLKASRVTTAAWAAFTHDVPDGRTHLPENLVEVRASRAIQAASVPPCVTRA